MAEYVMNNDGNPKKFAVSEAQAFSTAIWDRARQNEALSVIVYVHGRDMKVLHLGKDGEPKSSFKEGIVAELESSGSVVAMLHWPHKVPVGDFNYMPIDDAVEAGPSLRILVIALARAKPLDLTTRLILLTHSMGAIVLKAACSCEEEASWNSLTHVVISASAVNVAGSRSWINKLAVSTYVMLNPQDKMLKNASNGGPFVGLQSGPTFPASEIADNAVYLDVAKLDVNHRYFVKAGSNSNAAGLEKIANRVFRPLYRGDTLDMSTFGPVGLSGRIFEIA